MRATILVIAVVLALPAHAAPKLIDHEWGSPDIRLDLERSRRTTGPILTSPPHTPMRELPLLTEAERKKLQATADASKGDAHIAALESLIGSLEREFDVADDGGMILEDLQRRATALLADPDLERYPNAPELVMRCAQWAVSNAKKAMERMIALHPSSPFVTDAHMSLASLAEVDKHYPEAKAHWLAAIASKRIDFVLQAQWRLAWVKHLMGDSDAALRDLTDVANQSTTLRPAIAEVAIFVYAKSKQPAARAEDYFTSIEPNKIPERLRVLSDAYLDAKRPNEAIVVLRRVLQIDSDRVETCRDRAEIAAALANAPNRADAEVAADAALAGVEGVGEKCKADVESALTELALAWHKTVRKRGDRARVAQMWTRVLQVSTNNRSGAERNRLALRWEMARGDRHVETWIAIGELADHAVAAGAHVREQARDAWLNAQKLATDDAQREKIREALGHYTEPSR